MILRQILDTSPPPFHDVGLSGGGVFPPQRGQRQAGKTAKTPNSKWLTRSREGAETRAVLVGKDGVGEAKSRLTEKREKPVSEFSVCKTGGMG